jgi:flagella basal body P-ring formation protein FlgA
MSFRILLALCWLARFAPAQAMDCATVDGDRILGKHLVDSLPAFRGLPADMVLGSMPLPGSRRIFHTPELTSLAERFQIRLEAPQEVCFEWRMAPLDRGQVMLAMRASLDSPEARIEITEISSGPVPPGRLEFPREMLGRPAIASQKDPVVWRGNLVYGDDHRYAVWAKVRIKVACERLIAAESIKAGQSVDSTHMRVERGECFPTGKEAAASSSVGLIAVRAIAAGSEIRQAFLAPPNDVHRGDAVHVEVRSGAALLAFTAKAESDGRSGDLIAVRNPSSNRIFRARVAGKDRVVVQTETEPSGR